MRILIVVVAVLGSGCIHASRPRFLPPTPVRIELPRGDEPCLDRLVERSKIEGYEPQSIDRDTRSFRVEARNQDFAYVTDRNGRRVRPKVRKGSVEAQVEFFSIQCVDEANAVIAPMNEQGPVVPPQVLDGAQSRELHLYAQALGRELETTVVRAPVVAAEKCVASEHPEWATASAERKKALLEGCRGSEGAGPSGPAPLVADASPPERRKYYGGAVPRGFHLASEGVAGAIIGGAAAFAAAYLLWGVIGAAHGHPENLIPIAGPIVGFQPDNSRFSSALNGLTVVGIVLDVAVQVGGLVAMIAGFSVRRVWLERDEPAARITIAPVAPGADVGATIRATF